MNAPPALAFPVATLQIIGDRLRYLAFINPERTPPRTNSGPFSLGRGRGSAARSLPELAPRQALHLVACRNGHEAT